MSKEQTAFKHPNCGGVILQVHQNDTIFFECDRCGESAEDIGRLIMRSLVIIRTRSKSQPTTRQTNGDDSLVQGAEADGPPWDPESQEDSQD